MAFQPLAHSEHTAAANSSFSFVRLTGTIIVPLTRPAQHNGMGASASSAGEGPREQAGEVSVNGESIWTRARGLGLQLGGGGGEEGTGMLMVNGVQLHARVDRSANGEPGLALAGFTGAAASERLRVRVER